VQLLATIKKMNFKDLVIKYKYRILRISFSMIFLILSLDLLFFVVFRKILIDTTFFYESIFSYGFMDYRFRDNRFVHFIYFGQKFLIFIFSLTFVIFEFLNRLKKIKFFFFSSIILLNQILFFVIFIISNFHYLKILIFFEFSLTLIIAFIIIIFYYKSSDLVLSKKLLKFYLSFSFILNYLFCIYFCTIIFTKLNISNEPITNLIQNPNFEKEVFISEVIRIESQYEYLNKSSLLKYSEYFSSIDIVYMAAQIDGNYNFKWEKGMFQDSSILLTNEEIYSVTENDTDDFWGEFHKKYNSCISSFSKPLFSISGKYAIIENTYTCDGDFGGGVILIFEKVENNWQLIKFDGTWIS
jgi:hypothetical protein